VQELIFCFTAASKICCVVYIGLFTGPVNQWSSSSARQIFKEYFHSLVQILKHNFHTESETERLKSDFEVLVCEYAQIFIFSGTLQICLPQDRTNFC